MAEIVHRMIEVYSKGEVREVRRKMVDWMIEAICEHKVSEIRSGVVHWLIKVVPKRGMCEGRRERRHRVIKGPRQMETTSNRSTNGGLREEGSGWKSAGRLKGPRKEG